MRGSRPVQIAAWMTIPLALVGCSASGSGWPPVGLFGLIFVFIVVAILWLIADANKHKGRKP
jgi:hypothetical protein